MNQAVPPVEAGGELRFYYGGKDYEHNDAGLKKGHGAIGFGTLRRHGFYSLASGNHIGQLLTKPLVCAGADLEVNAVVSRSLKVAVEDAFARPLEGFGLEDCIPISGDHLRAPVRWRNGKGLGSLRGKPLRLRMEIDRGEIYSFRIA
jgi:hypothetical protein